MNTRTIHAICLFVGFVAAGVTAGCEPRKAPTASTPTASGPSSAPAASASAAAATQTKLDANATLSRADAEKIALTRARGGNIKEAELEQEHGKLVWSFDIATPGTNDITEVQVNAVTGEIVSVEKETPAQQAAEKKQDEKK